MMPPSTNMPSESTLNWVFFRWNGSLIFVVPHRYPSPSSAQSHTHVPVKKTWWWGQGMGEVWGDENSKANVEQIQTLKRVQGQSSPIH